MRLITSCTPAAVPISVCTKRATACPSGSGERAVVATEAPLRVKRRTIACPIPFVPPVTRTRLPLNSSPETGKGYVIVMIESPVKQSCCLKDVVQFNGTPRELAGESGTHGHVVSMRLRVDHLKNVSVFLVRRLLPLADRVTTAIIPPLVVDSAVFGEAAGKRVRVLRLFGGQVCCNRFGCVESHRILLRAIAQSGVSHHTDKIGSTHEKVR